MRLVEAGWKIITPLDGVDVLQSIEKIARTCYKSTDKSGDFDKTKRFISNLVKRGHEAMLEHYSFSVKFIVDRGVSHELVRHRLAAFAQESTRYCNYSGGVTFVIPSWINRGIIKHNEYCKSDMKLGYADALGLSWSELKWLNAMLDAEEYYLDLIKVGCTPQEARSVLPNSLKTEIVITANIREWRHIFKLRAIGVTGSPHPQMIEVMLPLLVAVQNTIPVIFDDLII